MTSATAYKVLLGDEMAVLEKDGWFDGSAIDQADGFIHLSTADQLTETVDRHFAGRDDLHVVEVDLAAHGDKVRWEPSRGGASFPHLYGPMSLEAVIAYGPLHRGADGGVLLPVMG
ncbi:DUF952 domain-containing protein [uncultured Sphingomonas sp.]|uniref:DUF952 domain-containing protein n=1 Tax=uncultured Sphingomonas sp. TaxID=158754 RepID=UPI0035C9BD71